MCGQLLSCLCIVLLFSTIQTSKYLEYVGSNHSKSCLCCTYLCRPSILSFRIVQIVQGDGSIAIFFIPVLGMDILIFCLPRIEFCECLGPVVDGKHYCFYNSWLFRSCQLTRIYATNMTVKQAGYGFRLVNGGVHCLGGKQLQVLMIGFLIDLACFFLIFFHVSFISL